MSAPRPAPDVLGAAVVALVATRARARWWLARDGFATIVARLAEPHAPRTSTPPLEPLCLALDRAERLVDRVPGIGRQCLHRALGRFAALRRAGVDATLLLGVRTEADLVGHAWVEVDGRPVLEREEPRFIVTFSSARAMAPSPSAA